MEATTLSRKAVGKSTEMPRVLAAARVRTEMVMAAPAMLMVAPKGMETEYFSSSRPSSLHSRRLTGILAAELRVKKANDAALLQARTPEDRGCAGCTGRPEGG